MYDRIYTYYNEALELYHGHIPRAPRMAIIYVTYACNFSCEGCLCRDFHFKDSFMDFEKFKDITMQLKKQGVKSIELCGGGEPLLHPDIKKMITWVSDVLHMNIGVMSNSSMLDDHLSYLLATRANYVRTSLYEHRYEEVVKKVKRLIEIKEKVSGRPIIGAKFLVNDNNEDFVLSRVEEIRKIPGINHISIKARRGYGETHNFESFEKEIIKLNDKRININVKNSYLKENCWMTPIHTLIDPMGKVFICCYYMNRDEQHCIGNVYEKPFSEIWGSKEHLEKLHHLEKEKCNVFDCRWHDYNEKMLELFKNDLLHPFC